MFHAGGMM